MQNIQRDVGARIRELRKRKNWSQEKLAERAGCHWTYIGGLERGERNATLKVLANVARALGCRVRDLFSRDGLK
jgi:transcriptional regulator with XRE-family HTH domain